MVADLKRSAPQSLHIPESSTSDMKCLTAVALAGLMLSHGHASMLKKASKALGSYALIKALEPKVNLNCFSKLFLPVYFANYLTLLLF